MTAQKRQILATAILVSTILTACGDSDDPVANAVASELNTIPTVGTTVRSELDRTNPEIPLVDADKLASDNLRFAFNLYQQVTADSDDNIFFSPHSISVALAMTYAGARSTTAEQMATAMQFGLPAEQLHPAFNVLDQKLNSNTSEDFELSIVNQIWGRQGEQWQPEFLDALAQHYGAGLQELDFRAQSEQSRIAINDWVAEVTQERIKDLLPPASIDADTAMVLTNAIYFNALWQSEFDPADTFDRDFTRADGSTVSVPLMHAMENYNYFKGGNYEAILLPYKEAGMSMIALVPPAGDFAAFEQSLDAAVFNEAISGLSNTLVDLALPRLEFEAPLGLKSHLEALGMPLAFSEIEADFSGIRAEGELFISDVLHKAFVKVDEKGTEAAAATAVTIGVTSAAPAAEIILHLDRPYVFAIYDNTGKTVLFLGRVLDPSV